ncbi:MAG: DUF5050 domain-containing protein [Anaerovoracaceae bacterium]|jgi:hypothetical protein
MNKKISKILVISMAVTCLLLTSIFAQTVPTVYAAAPNVTVKLPAFKVTLNGTVIDNKTSQYPLITYKDITYFPMTYFDCRFLGLESAWNSSTGLNIVKTGASWSYNKYQAKAPNSSTYAATIASFPIKVNEKSIDNSKEAYPLLLFRNVTYFPLTWRFAVEEFGWDYSFDSANGLAINSTKGGTVAGQITLPIVTREGGEKGAFTMAGDYFYYEGSNGAIYQTPIDNLTQKKKVYQLPKTGDMTHYVYANLETENGKALLFYHTGGAVMGSNHLIWLKEDGTFEEIDSGYFTLKTYEDYQIKVNQGFPPYANNLQIRKVGEKDYVSVGKPNYIYGWAWNWTEAGTGGFASEDLYLIDDEIYVLGNADKENKDITTGICKVNIHTSETQRICQEAASGFKIVDDTIYFTDFEQSLYKVPIHGGKSEKIIDEPVGSYNVFNGKLYYSLWKENNQLYIYGDGKSVNPGGRLKSLEIQDGYMVAVFEKDSQSQYKMMIFDETGKVIYKTIENVLLVRIGNGKVVFVKESAY